MTRALSTDGPTGPDALSLIEEGVTDPVAYGRLFLADRDLPAPLRAGLTAPE